MTLGTEHTDDRHRTWRVETALGRGLWGSSWLVRDADGKELVLRVALADADLPADVPAPPGILAASAAAITEQAALLRDASQAFLPKLEGTVKLPDGRTGLLVPRYASSVQRELSRGAPLGRILALLVKTADLVAELDRPHADLRPSNVLINDRGEPVLTDLLPDAIRTHRHRFVELAPGRREYSPPEAAQFPSPGWDTYAICAMAWEAAVGEDGQPLPLMPRAGLDKIGLARVKDRALARLKEEGANARFVNRVADRLGSLLNRGLSLEHHPSPPYRFEEVADLLPRLREVSGLVSPRVEAVGRMLLATAARDGVFQGGDDVTFSVTIAVTEGVVNHEHVACGVQVRDLDAVDSDGRVHVPDTRFSVQTHPSGRLRFEFSLPALPPGRYHARVAFAMKDAGQEPQAADGDFEVRPPPGYVPPTEPPRAPRPVDLAQARRARTPDAPPERPTSPGGARPLPQGASRGPALGTEDAWKDFDLRADADALPTPVAPSSPGVEVDLEVEPSLDDGALLDVPGSRTPRPVARSYDDAPPAGGPPPVLAAVLPSPRVELPPLGGPRVGDTLDQPERFSLLDPPTTPSGAEPALPPVRPAAVSTARPVEVTPPPALRAATPAIAMPRPASQPPAAEAARPAGPTALGSGAPAHAVSMTAPAMSPPPAPRVAPQATAQPTPTADDDWLPGSGITEDLPEWTGDMPAARPNPLLDLGRQVLDIVRRDPVTTVLVLVAAFLMSALVLLVVVQALLF